ncbi:hypothetical protein GCM10007108_00210 [Thermogymnomonas acidicola]|uniref:Uncharacterized protein n=1 Tax=Thermogymnomonas acidicola TaxID=399579 RepID=A0AA37BPK6_9ARCH|nr:enoyl-CoA hydratase-related protein [Thermogymnomonas acidicola]GGM65887.1 hypothetical protein GCM10007108_00210 [Thermogymnomonas acidicola]
MAGGIRTEKHGQHIRVVIDAGQGNQLSTDGLRSLLSALADALAAGPQWLTLMGAGGDLSRGFQATCLSLNDAGFLREARSLARNVSRLMMRDSWVTVALVDGYALGLGLELALSADLVVATPRSRFGMPELIFKFPPLTDVLTDPVGKLSAAAMGEIRSGRIFGAREALELGIVDYIVPPGSGILEFESGLLRSLDWRSVVARKRSLPLREIGRDTAIYAYLNSIRPDVRSLEGLRNTL